VGRDGRRTVGVIKRGTVGERWGGVGEQWGAGEQ
jgi:hypothetical protein